MKIPRTLFAVAAAAFLTVASAFAGDPSGTWKWSVPGRDGQPRESVLKLTLADGKLSGTVTGRGGQELPISDASFADDAVKFTVAMTWGERSFSMKYDGKLEGDTITGTVERPDRDGGVRKMEWKAARAPAQ
ncbi:MAG: hypothetical protein IAE82_12660 [Opitutaceae bacterium]|nr:hypothetical protein [Opitutaceae bacterium]